MNLKFRFTNANSLSKITLGNGTVQNITLNGRLQLQSQELKRGTETLQKYVYGYGQIDGSGNVDTTKNNGQLSQIESYIGTVKQWTQKFSYDQLGRLSESKEYRGDTNALTYKQHFDFDRFGNLYRKQANNQVTGQENPLPYTAMEDSDISKATNRFTAQTTYDEAGQVITDNKFRGMGFGYDANGRMVKATEANQPDALSVYDAAGMRVAECVNNVWKFSVYDIGGKMIAEYGGQQSTDEGGVKYVLQDWQGSSRAIVNNSGFAQSRIDYTAFGEEINSGVGQRITNQGFGANNTLNKKYALTERDRATGLDHTWYRKNEIQAGRWTSPDPFGGSASVGDPQSFNRYSYVQGQPTNYVDPSGLNMAGPGTRYGPFDPMGIAYYLDGVLSDARSVWGLIDAGGGYIEYSNVPGVDVINHWEPFGDGGWRFTGQTVHFFGSGESGDPLWSVGELVLAARRVVDKAQGECAKLLGPDASNKFANIAKNIKYDAKRFQTSLVSAETVGQSIYLNPNGIAFNTVTFSGKDSEKLNDRVQKAYGRAANRFDYAVASVIHEFLHAIGKFGPDANAFDSSQSQKNQNRVLEKCFPKPK